MMGQLIYVGFWLSEGTFPAITARDWGSAVFTQRDKRFMLLVENLGREEEQEEVSLGSLSVLGYHSVLGSEQTLRDCSDSLLAISAAG